MDADPSRDTPAPVGEQDLALGFKVNAKGTAAARLHQRILLAQRDHQRDQGLDFFLFSGIFRVAFLFTFDEHLILVCSLVDR